MSLVYSIERAGLVLGSCAQLAPLREPPPGRSVDWIPPENLLVALDRTHCLAWFCRAELEAVLAGGGKASLQLDRHLCRQLSPASTHRAQGCHLQDGLGLGLVPLLLWQECTGRGKLGRGQQALRVLPLQLPWGLHILGDFDCTFGPSTCPAAFPQVLPGRAVLLTPPSVPGSWEHTGSQDLHCGFPSQWPGSGKAWVDRPCTSKESGRLEREAGVSQ